MDIYIEYVTIDNLVINFLILLCVKNTLRLKTSFLRLLLSSLLGTIVAVILPIFELSTIIKLFIKIMLGISMVLILSSYFRFKDFIFAFLLFIAYTLALGGACFATLLAFGTSLEALSAGGYDISVPLGLILAIIAFYVSIIIYLAKYLSRKRDLTPFIRRVILFLGNKTFEFDAFIDTGNKLIDSKTGLPVIILSINGLEKYFLKEDIEKLMLMQGEGTNCFKDVHLTAYNTISGDSKKMVVFSADKLVIISKDSEYTTNRFMIGVSYKRFNDVVHYDMLLNPSVM